MKNKIDIKIPKSTSGNVGALKGFLAFGKRFLGQIIKERKKWFILVIIFDAISAATKIAAVFIVALAVKMLSNRDQTNIIINGIEIQNDITMIVILGVTLGVCLLVSALLLYQSRVLTRAIGRWVNQAVLNDVYNIFNQSAEKAAGIKFPHFENINAMLTQVPIHSGLAAETIIRLINPLFLLTFASLSLLYQQSYLAVVIFAASLLFVPIVIKFSHAVQSNSQSFYSNKSLAMGMRVSAIVNLAIHQSGAINQNKQKPSEEEAMNSFYNAYDKNLLANEKVGLIISIADSVMRSFVFILMCILVYLDEFSAGATVIFLGVLIYMLSSARAVASLTTNLLRYYPQTRRYLALTEAIKNTEYSKATATNADTSQTDQGKLRYGDSTLLLSPYPLTTLTLRSIIGPLIHSEHLTISDLHEIRFASANYRFHDGTVIEHLLGAQSGKELQDKALDLAKDLNADTSFAALSNGYQTKVNQAQWDKMSAEARLALRCIPLILNSKQNLIFIDYNLVKPVSIKSINKIFKQFSDCKLVVTMLGGKMEELPSARWHLSINEDDSISSGDNKWFEEQLASAETSNVEGNNPLINMEIL